MVRVYINHGAEADEGLVAKLMQAVFYRQDKEILSALDEAILTEMKENEKLAYEANTFPLLTAKEAEALGAGKAEFLGMDGTWHTCNEYCKYKEEEACWDLGRANFKYSYRAKEDKEATAPKAVEIKYSQLPVGTIVEYIYHNKIVKQGQLRGATNRIVIVETYNSAGIPSTEWLQPNQLKLAKSNDQRPISIADVPDSFEFLHYANFSTTINGFRTIVPQKLKPGYYMEGSFK